MMSLVGLLVGIEGVVQVRMSGKAKPVCSQMRVNRVNDCVHEYK
jgi:hypothetical protein